MAEKIFRVRQLNQEGDKWGITIGDHLATPKTFKDERSANSHLKWLNSFPWETVVAVVAEMLEIHDKSGKEVNNESD